MTIKFRATTPESVRRILLDKDLFRRLLVETPSQEVLASKLDVVSAELKTAREHWGFPVRPQKLDIPASLEGIPPRKVLDDPELTRYLMIRAYCRAGVCPPWCHYWDTSTCPKSSSREADPDESLGNGMPDGCPVRFYQGSDRNGDAPLYVELMRAGRRLAAKEPEEGAEEEEEIKVEERDADTPETFRAFLEGVTSG